MEKLEKIIESICNITKNSLYTFGLVFLIINIVRCFMDDNVLISAFLVCVLTVTYIRDLFFYILRKKGIAQW